MELRALGVIALPLMAAYFAEYLMFVTTKLVVGGLGHHELAATGLAGELLFSILVVLMGLLSVVGVLAAQGEGAGQKAEVGRAVRQGFVVATVMGLPATLAIWHLDRVMAWTGQDPEIVRLAGPFLHWASLSVLPVLWFAVARNYVAALSRTGAVMAITTACVGLNWALCTGLVHGRFGLPEMGLAGAGLAVSMVNWVMFLALITYAWITPALRGYGVFRGRWRVEPALCREIVGLGLPVAGIVALESGLFVAVGLISGTFGPDMLAANTVIMAWIAIPFVLAMGLAEATMVRVAHGIGRGAPAGARTAGVLGMQIGVVALAVLVVVPVTQGEVIVSIFLAPDDPGFDNVAPIALSLFGIAAVFQVFDGLQAIASRALRGLKDTAAPLWIAAFGYWVLGIGGGTALAFGAEWGGRGIWWGLALGLVVTAVLLAGRFLRLTERLQRGRGVTASTV